MLLRDKTVGRRHFFRKRAVITVIAAAAALFAGCGGEPDGVRTTQTDESLRLQEEMERTVQVGEMEIAEDESGQPVLTAQVSLPDYSAYFADCMEEAAEGTEDEAAFEKRLFELAFERASGDGAETGTEREPVSYTVTVKLAQINAEKPAESWTQEELTRLAAEAAFEAELEEFSVNLWGSYLIQTTDWDKLAAPESGDGGTESGGLDTSSSDTGGLNTDSLDTGSSNTGSLDTDNRKEGGL